MSRRLPALSTRKLCDGLELHNFLRFAQAWSAGVDQASPLFAVDVLAKLAPANAALVPALAESLLLQHADALKAGATVAAAQAALACCLHWSREVRRAGRSAVTRCVASSTSSTGVY